MKSFNYLPHVKSIDHYEDLHDFYEQHKDQIRQLSGDPSQFTTRDAPPSQAIYTACSAVLSCAYFLSREIGVGHHFRNDKKEPYVIHLVGASDEAELNFNGDMFFMLPLLLQHLSSDGKSLPKIEVHCYNPEFKRSGRIRVPGIKLVRWARRYTADTVRENLDNVDLVLMANPGFESHPESWLNVSKGGPVPLLSYYSIPTVVASYGVIDNETDKFVLNCYGFAPEDREQTPDWEFNSNPFAGPNLLSVGQTLNDPLATNIGGYMKSWFDLSDYEYMGDVSPCFEGEEQDEVFIDEGALAAHQALCESLFTRLFYYGDEAWFDFGGTGTTGDGHLGIEIDAAENLVFFPELGVLARAVDGRYNRIDDAQLVARLKAGYSELCETFEDYQHLILTKVLIGMGLFEIVAQSGKVELNSPKNNMPYSDPQEVVDLFVSQMA